MSARGRQVVSAQGTPLVEPEHPAHLSGSVAIVTGASRGIGRAIAKELATHGASILLNYLEHSEEAERLGDELSGLARDFEIFQADVADRAQAHRMVDRAVQRFGCIDILVNNAGITRDRTLQKMTFEEWDRVLQVDLFGVFNCTRAVVSHMIDRGAGRIVNIASIIAQSGGFGQANYAAAKAGIIGFSRSCALELAPHGITVNVVSPGFVDTDMLRVVPPQIKENIRQRIPLGRFGHPDEIAKCVRFLVTEGQYITGQCINVNGGLFM